MSIKVKAKISFSEIIEKLHKVAKDFAEKTDGKIKLDNLAFNDKTGKFLGGGQYCIFMARDGEEVTENDKSKFMEVIKTYVHYFVGEEEVKYIAEDDLQPIYRGSTGNPEEDEKEEQKKKEENGEGDKGTENNEENKEKTKISESLFIRNKSGKLMKLLFEADDIKEGEAKSGENNPDTPKQDDQETQNLGKCIGYGVMYDISVEGKKDTTIQDAIQNKAIGLFGGVLADLRNIKVKIGGHPVNLGHIFDPKKWEEAIGMKDIDLTQVSHDVKSAFDSEYRGNKVECSAQDKDWLTSTLNREKKLTPEIKSQINKADYSVLVKTDESDPHYQKYNRKSVAHTVSKAFGTTYNAGIDWNAVDQDDVIKIDDVGNVNIPKNKDEKDEKSTLDKINSILKTDQEKKDREENKNKKTVKESTEESNGQESGDKHKIIYYKLKEQIDKELKNETLHYGYENVDKFLNLSYVKNLNDSEFTNDLKNNCKNVLFIITKNSEENDGKFSEEQEPNKELFEARYEKLIDTVVESILKEDENNGDANAEQSKKNYKELAIKIFKNVFIESAKELNIENVDVKNVKVLEKDVDISDIQLKEAEEQDKNNTQLITKDEYIEGLQSNMENKLQETEDYTYEIKTIEEIVKFLNDGNYEGNVHEIQKYEMGCIIKQKNQEIKENVQLLKQVHSDTSGSGTNQKIQDIGDQYEEVIRKMGYKGIMSYIKTSESSTIEELEYELQNKAREFGIKVKHDENSKSKANDQSGYHTDSKDGLNINKFTKITNEILQRYDVKEVAGLYTFKKLKVAAESLIKKNWKEMLIESLFGDLIIEKTNSQIEQDHITNEQAKELIQLIRRNTLKNIQKNKEQIEKKWGEQKKGQKGFQWPGKYKEQYKEFKNLVFNQDDEQKVIDYVNQSIHNKGDNSKLQKVVLTRFIPAIKQLQNEETTEYPIAVSDGGKLVPKKETEIVPIEKDESILVMPFNVPKQEQIEQLDRKTLELPYRENTTSGMKRGSGKMYVTYDITDKQNSEENKEAKDGQKKDATTDWYIIPHKRIKNLERHHERSTDQNGVTTTHTSNADYKPKGK